MPRIRISHIGKDDRALLVDKHIHQGCMSCLLKKFGTRVVYRDSWGNQFEVVCHGTSCMQNSSLYIQVGRASCASCHCRPWCWLAANCLALAGRVANGLSLDLSCSLACIIIECMQVTVCRSSMSSMELAKQEIKLGLPFHTSSWATLCRCGEV